MSNFNCLASVCRHCRFYTPEGRRGGQCQQLGVPVRGVWKSCSLAIPPFAPSWETIEVAEVWTQKALVVPDALPLACSLEFAQLEELGPESSAHHQKMATNLVLA